MRDGDVLPVGDPASVARGLLHPRRPNNLVFIGTAAAAKQSPHVKETSALVLPPPRGLTFSVAQERLKQ